MVGRRGEKSGASPAQFSALIHLIPGKAAARFNTLKFVRKLVVSRASPAALSWRDGRAVGAGLGGSEKRADLVRRFGREDVFELAGLLLDFGFAVHGQAIGEEALREAVRADDAAGTFSARRRKFDDQRSVAD